MIGILIPGTFSASVGERAFRSTRKNRLCEESKIKPEVQSGAPECNFFARVASRQIAGQPAVETDDSAFGACQAQSGHGGVRLRFISRSVSCRQRNREAISSCSRSGRCSHRRKCSARERGKKRESEGEWERKWDTGCMGKGRGKKKRERVLVDWVTDDLCILITRSRCVPRQAGNDVVDTGLVTHPFYVPDRFTAAV